MTAIPWDIEACFGTVWTSILADVMTRNPTDVSSGIDGSDITDRVAKTGSIRFLVNNDVSNSGGTLGWYSPDNANCRSGWGIGTKVRYSMTDGTVPYTKFVGRISTIEPDFGIYGNRGVSVTALDYMDILATYKLKLLALQQAQRPDQVVGTVVAALSITPDATNYMQDNETYTYALHNEQDEKTTAMSVLQKIAQSSLSYIYDAGGTLTYEPRGERLKNITSAGTISDTMTGLTVKREANRIYNTIKATIYPVEVGDSLVVLASSPAAFSVPPSGTVTQSFRYRDPVSGKNRVSGYGMVTPEADTDYRFSFAPTGSGNQANGSVTVSCAFGGNSASATIINGYGQTVYANLFQMRGYMVSVYDPVEVVKEDATSQAAYGERTLTFSQPYQASTNYADSIATWLLSRFKDPYSDISAVEFTANASANLQTLGITLGISDRVTIQETVTGVSRDFFINQVSYTMGEGCILKVNWILEPASPIVYWILGDAVYGVLDVTTLPGP